MTLSPVTLTFDNGPTPGVTDAVLDVLGGHHIASVPRGQGHSAPGHLDVRAHPVHPRTWALH